VGVVAEGDAASVGPTKLNTVDHEAVEVVVPPAEDKLQGGAGRRSCCRFGLGGGAR
jgi:hypothetical protein